MQGPQQNNSSIGFESARAAMIREQLQARGITNQRVLNAMEAIPREIFLPEKSRSLAYYDGAVPIGEDQTISQPYIVAMMTQLLGPSRHEKILEIGVGSGYQTAVLCQLVEHVIGIERIQMLAEQAQERLHSLNLTNFTLLVGDGSTGCPEYAPFDGILVAAAAPRLPESLVQQLADGGRLVIPVSIGGKYQEMQRITRRGEAIHIERLTRVRFVPLIGVEGYKVK